MQMQYFPDASWEKIYIQNPCCTNITYEHVTAQIVSMAVWYMQMINSDL